MKFNEWITQKDEFSELSNGSDLETMQDDAVVENQLDQWIDKLMGLLHTTPSDKKQKLLEKVINKLSTF